MVFVCRRRNAKQNAVQSEISQGQGETGARKLLHRQRNVPADLRRSGPDDGPFSQARGNSVSRRGFAEFSEYLHVYVRHLRVTCNDVIILENFTFRSRQECEFDPARPSCGRTRIESGETKNMKKRLDRWRTSLVRFFRETFVFFFSRGRNTPRARSLQFESRFVLISGRAEVTRFARVYTADDATETSNTITSAEAHKKNVYRQTVIDVKPSKNILPFSSDPTVDFYTSKLIVIHHDANEIILLFPWRPSHVPYET